MRYFTHALIFICSISIVSPANLQAQNITFDWVKQIGSVGSGATWAGEGMRDRTIALDTRGNVYNTGEFTGTIDFTLASGVKTLNSANGRFYVLKSDPSGDFLWVKQFGNDNDLAAHVSSIAVDTFGNIYLAGYFRDPFDLNTGTNTEIVTSNGAIDIFVSKLDSAGNFLWGKHIGGTSNDNPNSMAVDNAGNVFVTGTFGGEVNFNPMGTDVHIASGQGCFVLKLNTSGGYEWTKTWTGNGRSIALDGMGNIYTTGDFSGNRRDFDPGKAAADTFFMDAKGSFDIFISKLNPSGDFLWAKGFGDTTQDQGISIAVDEAGYAYATGVFSSTVNFGTGTTPLVSSGTAGTTESYIIKLDPSGNTIWAKQIDGNDYNWGYSIALGKGKATGIYATGTFNGTANFYQGQTTIPLSAAYYREGYIVKLDVLGNFEWSKQIGGNVSSTIAVDTNGNVYTAGGFNAPSADFDPGPDVLTLAKKGSSVDGFIHKMRWCDNNNDTIRVTTCKNFTFNGIVFTKTGVYIMPNPKACDSTGKTLLDLSIELLAPVISVNKFELSTTNQYYTYQWLLNGQVIPNATKHTYTVTENGDYSVIVTNEEGCIDTSDIYKVNNVDDVSVKNNIAAKISFHPNPSEDVIYINSPIIINLTLTSMEGRVIKEAQNAKMLYIKNLAKGLYLLNITDAEGKLLQVKKLVKQ